MIKKLTRLAFIALLALFVSSNARASHVPGGNISYECVGPNTFVMTLTLYEDCGTAFAPNSPVNISATNTCGLGTQTFSLPNITYQLEVSQLCPASLSQSECNGGSLPGIYMHQWRDTITLPGVCNAWTFSYTLCCRNTSTNLMGQGQFYIETTLNSVTSPCNNSVVINAQPIPYVCAGTPVSYSFGANDPDGHVLEFELIQPQSSAGATINYQAGYTVAAPIPGITINPTTGLINFTTMTTGNYVIAVMITEYDENGNVTGTVIQDFQFVVISCNNQAPSSPGVTNYTGQGQQVNPSTINLCIGNTACFQVTFSDSDPTAILSFDPSISNIPPGCTINSITGTNPMTFDVCVTFNSLTNNILSLGVVDDECPINAFSNYNVLIAPLLFPLNTTVKGTCPGIDNGAITVDVDTAGNYDFFWYALPDTSTTIQVSELATADSMQNLPLGNYMIIVFDSITGCFGLALPEVDTVIPHFDGSIIQESCWLNDGSITMSGNNGVAPWDYEWANAAAPGNILQNNQNLGGPSTFSNLGSGMYILTITDADGCTNDTTISIQPGPDVNISGTSTLETCYQYGDGDIMLIGTGGSGPYSYVVVGPENASQTNGLFNNMTAGDYWVYVYDQLGCVDSVMVNVPQAIPVVAAFVSTPSMGVPPLTVNFTNNSTNATGYIWDFGDTTTSFQTNPTHVYYYENDYPVMLIATNGVCADTAYGMIDVATSDMMFPNVFSPNGDGQNDEFHFNTKNMVSMSCVVYNRWGQEVYSFTDPDAGWNGKDKGGKDVAEGTYYYVVTGLGIDDVKYEHHGTVNLFRKK